MEKMKKRKSCEKFSILSIDWTIKLLVMLTSLYHVFDFTRQDRTQKSVMFVKNVWLPQLIVSFILAITSTLSSFFLTKASATFLYGDVFILTTIEKLLTIGYNSHLIIFFATLNDIDFAFMVLPISVFAFLIMDALVVVAYLDTVFFDILEWQDTLIKYWAIRMFTSILPQHLLCSFLYFHHSSMHVQFMKPIYKLGDMWE